MELPTGLLGALVTGLVVGGLGRLVAPGRPRPAIGCLGTVLIGLLGAVLGLLLARRVDAGVLVTLILQVAAAAVLVTLVSFAGRRRPYV